MQNMLHLPEKRGQRETAPTGQKWKLGVRATAGSEAPVTDLPVTREPWEAERFTLRERQIAVSICLGLTHEEIGEALGISRQDAGVWVFLVIDKCGMRNRLEFALEMNAAMRDQMESVEEAVDLPMAG